MEAGRAQLPRSGAKAGVAGVDAAGEPLIVGDSLQQVREPLLFVLGKRGEKGVLMLSGYATDGFEDDAPLGGEMEGVAAAVLGIAAALDEAAGFKIVEERDELAGDDTETSGELPLGNRRAEGKIPKNSAVRPRELELLQAFAELCGGVRAELREQEGGGIAATRRGASRFPLSRASHEDIVAHTNRSILESFLL